MSKLRVIKERTSVAHHDQDLRDLGGTTLLSNTGVEFVLSFKDLTPLAISQLQSVLKNQTSMQLVSEGNVSKVVCNVHQNHKVNCLHLFNLALIVIHKKITSSATLHEVSHLHEELSKSAGTKVYSQSHVAPASGLTISGNVSLTLHQAGYNISPNADGLVLNEHHLNTLISTLTSQQSEQQLLKKVRIS